MKKALIVIIAIVSCVTADVATAAVATVKKAAPVATKTSSSNTTSSLAGTALQFGLNVAQLAKQQKEMTAECIPSSAEITFVNNTIKEWAKTGAMTAQEVEDRLDRRPCSGGVGYESDVRESATTDLDDICFDNFVGYGDEGTVWYKYPKVGLATYCPDGSYTCSTKNKKTKSDIYEIFNLIDFTQDDYTKQEATMAAKLISKIENCSNAKLSQKKRAMWGEFLTTTIGGVGQKTSTGNIMDTVSQLTQNGSMGGLSSLGTIATQVLSK